MLNHTNQNHVTLNGMTLYYTATTISYNNKLVYTGTVNYNTLKAVSLLINK